MSIKAHVPFAVRHALRTFVDHAASRPRHYASGSVVPRTRVHRSYQRWYRRRHFRRFFSPLLAPGALVFDVGANVGAWTDALHALGCRVVAVEPQPDCAAVIAAAHRGDRGVDVVEVAIADAPGDTSLFLAAHSEQASISVAWMQSMIDHGGVAAGTWHRSVSVPVRTLEQLIARFGVPDYVKLDVEGAEPAALRGLRTPVALVSFETHGQTLGDAEACIARLLELGHYEFNLTPGEFPALEWREWRGADDVAAALAAEPFGWNNVFARQPRSAVTVRSTPSR